MAEQKVGQIIRYVYKGSYGYKDVMKPGDLAKVIHVNPREGIASSYEIAPLLNSSKIRSFGANDLFGTYNGQQWFEPL